ncbi:MAG TPA: SDR family NAD(P)-dependent oxidoreductase [Jatrophihabitantaceae bacterium]|jgi:short-subunit dehydrogenase
MSTIAIFGAGPALGLSVARRFGREGFTVALVARDQGHLDALVAELADDGVDAAGFPADLTDRAATLDAASAIEARFGSIDVLEYSPAGESDLHKAPSEVDVATMGPLLDGFTLTPVALATRVLPAMVERGSGGLLFALGAAAKHPNASLAPAGIAQAGLRNYVHTLHDELAPKNVYVGALIIGALIEGSAAHRNAAAWGDVPVVTATDLADRYWDLYLKRDRIEDDVPTRTPS